MKHIATFALAVLALSSPAQIVMSVQNGPWSAPSTWDCACVPAVSDEVHILHSVELMGNYDFAHPLTHVMTGGEITSTMPANITVSGTFTNNGHILFIGNTQIIAPFTNNGFAEFVGVLYSDGSIIVAQGSVMQVEGDFINYFQVAGNGAICVTDSTMNYGTLQGAMDFCDWSPTTASAPYIDVNTGTVDNLVTYCTNSPCFTTVPEDEFTDATMAPNPAHDLVRLAGLPSGTDVAVLDAAGKRVIRGAEAMGAATVDVSMLRAGAYTVLLSNARGRSFRKLLVTR